jgi:hypothetical protein
MNGSIGSRGSRTLAQKGVRLLGAMVVLVASLGADCGITCNPVGTDPGAQACSTLIPCSAGTVRACIDKCVTPVAVGDNCSPNPCDDNGTCEGGASCMETVGRGSVCLRLDRGAGTPCHQSSVAKCASGLYCEADRCHGDSAPARCSDPQKVGQSCDSNFDAPLCFACEAGAFCDKGVCHKLCTTATDCPCGKQMPCVVPDPGEPKVCCKAAGAPCTAFGDCCGTGTRCLTTTHTCGQCVGDGKLGCADASDCCNGTRSCVNGFCKCSDFLQACQTAADCCSGYCIDNTTPDLGGPPKFCYCLPDAHLGCCGTGCSPVTPGGGGGGGGDAGTDTSPPPPPSTSWVLWMPYTATTVGEPGFIFDFTTEFRPGTTFGRPYGVVPLGFVYVGTTGPTEIDGLDVSGSPAIRIPTSGTAAVVVDDVNGVGSIDAVQSPGTPAVDTFNAVVAEQGQAAYFNIIKGAVARTITLGLTTKPAYVDIQATYVSFHPWISSGVEEVAVGTTKPPTLWYFSVGGSTATPPPLGFVQLDRLPRPLGEVQGVSTGNDDVWVVSEKPDRFARFARPSLSTLSNDILPASPFGLDIAKTDDGVTTFVMVGTKAAGSALAQVLAYPGGVTKPVSAIRFDLPASMGEPMDLAATMIGDVAYAWIATKSPNSIVRVTLRGTRFETGSSVVVTPLGAYVPVQIKVTDGPVTVSPNSGGNAGAVTILARVP